MERQQVYIIAGALSQKRHECLDNWRLATLYGNDPASLEFWARKLECLNDAERALFTQEDVHV